MTFIRGNEHSIKTKILVNISGKGVLPNASNGYCCRLILLEPDEQTFIATSIELQSFRLQNVNYLNNFLSLYNVQQTDYHLTWPATGSVTFMRIRNQNKEWTL